MRKKAEIEMLAKVLKTKAMHALLNGEAEAADQHARVLAAIEWCLVRPSVGAAHVESMVSYVLTNVDREIVNEAAYRFDTNVKVQVGT